MPLSPLRSRRNSARGRAHRNDRRSDSPLSSRSPRRHAGRTHDVPRERDHRRREHSSDDSKRRRTDERTLHVRHGSRDHERDEARPRARRPGRSRERHPPTSHSSDRSRSRSRRREGRSHRHRQRRHHSPSRSRSRSRKRRRHRSRPPAPAPAVTNPPRDRAPLPSQAVAFTTLTTPSDPSAPPPVEKQAPNFNPTGILAALSNTITTHAHTSTPGAPATKDIVLKYHEPPEARLPPAAPETRLYCFKAASGAGKAAIDDKASMANLGSRSCWLVGRQREVVDILAEHPSVSGQHAVLQWRFRPSRAKDTEGRQAKGGVKLYVIDLDSANGTWLNGERIEGGRYVEVLAGDVLKWAEGSSREWVVVRG